MLLRFLAALFAFALASPVLCAHGWQGIRRPRGATLQTPSVQESASAEDTATLADFKNGIVDVDATPEARRVAAKFLLKSPISSAVDLVAEILTDRNLPHAQVAVCEALTEVGRESAELLRPELVDALIGLVRGVDEGLQALAAEALALYPDGGVAVRLRAVAADGSLAQSARLAAIGALAPNLGRREVVAQLIGLLDDGTPAVVERALSVLAPATDQPLGHDVLRWKKWWQTTVGLSDTQWLLDFNAVLMSRVGRLDLQVRTNQTDSQERDARLFGVIAELQRDVFRRLPADERDAKLVKWLSDDVAVVRRTAIDLVMQPLSDEGRRPVEAVRSALMERLSDPLPEVRRAAIEIIGAIADPTDAQAVLARLAEEKELGIRRALLDALGKLRSASAIPALVAEVDGAKDIDSVRAAALALARLAGLSDPDPGQVLLTAVAPLKKRMAALPVEDTATRSALLRAMAEIADPSFAEDFKAHLSSEDPAVLRPVLRGLLAMGEAALLPRVRSLLSQSPDALVRQRAAEFVANFGRADADLDALASRSKRANEPDGAVRSAAWNGFLSIVQTRPAQQRLMAATRLTDDATLEEAFLSRLVSTLRSDGSDATVLESASVRLAEVLMSQSKYAEAVPHIRLFYDARRAREEMTWTDAAGQLLHAALRSSQYDAIGEIVLALADVNDQTLIDGAVMDIRAYLDSPEVKADPQHRRTGPRAAALMQKLRSIPAEGLGEEWAKLVAPVAAPTPDKKPSDQAEPLPANDNDSGM